MMTIHLAIRRILIGCLSMHRHAFIGVQVLSEHRRKRSSFRIPAATFQSYRRMWRSPRDFSRRRDSIR